MVRRMLSLAVGATVLALVVDEGAAFSSLPGAGCVPLIACGLFSLAGFMSSDVHVFSSQPARRNSMTLKTLCEMLHHNK
jgi:hypothetical protein